MNVRKTLNVVGTTVAILLMIPLIGIIVGEGNRPHGPATPMDECFQQNYGLLTAFESHKGLGWLDRQIARGDEAKSLCDYYRQQSPWAFEAKYGKANSK
jgi:hypothetical protein